MVMGWVGVQELPSVGRLASCRLLCSYVLMFLWSREGAPGLVLAARQRAPPRRSPPSTESLGAVLPPDSSLDSGAASTTANAFPWNT